MKTLFEACVPREDVRKGNIRESDFAADLAQVLNGQAPNEYQRADLFYANTHPTEGLRRLLKNVLTRLDGSGGEASAIFRLDTQYGGGKTHSLIALVHAAHGMPGVSNIPEFVPPHLVPKGRVRLAAFDGENADPANGRLLEPGLRAYTPWGELAWALAGREGYESVRASDEQRVPPGAETVRNLFGGEPTLILLDELSIYLRKVRNRPEAAQLTPFLTTLFKAVESSPQAALVFTLAIGKGGHALDAYSEENEFLAKKLEEAESVAARKATLLDPTGERETAQVLRRRLFSSVDHQAASEIVAAYAERWRAWSKELPPPGAQDDPAGDFLRDYPFHPALMSTLTDKISTLGNFQRVRGMLRLLTQTVARLWALKPEGTHAIHLHHMDPGHEPTRNEVVTRLELSPFDPAIRHDVSSPEGGKSLAQRLDVEHYQGLAPYASFVARTILWNTFAFNEELKGVTADELRWSVLGPGLEPGFLNDARQRFVAESAYLDDRPGAPHRFLTEANLNQILRRHETQVDPEEMRSQLRDRIQQVFSGSDLQLILFPGGPYEVPDEVGDGRPLLVVLSYDAETVSAEAIRVPDLAERLFRHQGSQNGFRQLQNNLVFLVADDSKRRDMRSAMVRRLALERMRLPATLADLPEHQQHNVEELYRTSEQRLAVAIQECYRHLFFPSRGLKVEGAEVDLGHTAFDLPSSAEKPGAGQNQVVRSLKDLNKLLRSGDPPLAPNFVRDRTPLKKGQITTGALRAEFRKDPNLPILLGDGNYIDMVRKGIEGDSYVYRSGDLVVGHGDPWSEIKIDEQSFVLTTAYAREQGVWPRPKQEPGGAGTAPTGAVVGHGGQVTVGPGGGSLSGGLKGAGHTGDGMGTAPTLPTTGARTFQSEAPLREALTRVWEQARKVKVARLQGLSIRVFEAQDAFKLLLAVGRESGVSKRVAMTGEYETAHGSRFAVEYEGSPADAEPLKEFLVPQFRAAQEEGGETDLQTTYELTYEQGLDLTGQDPEGLTERLSRFASGAVHVSAVAREMQ